MYTSRRSLSALAVSLLLSACATSTPPSETKETVQVPESQLQDCQPFPKLISGDHAVVEKWAIQVAEVGKNCADDKRGLNETIRLRQKELR